MSFTFKDQQERGSSYWKLNSSILNDKAYIEMVRETIINVDNLHIVNPQKWWDIFLTCIRSKTIAYTKQKHFIENSTRDKLRKDLFNLEALPSELLTPSQTAHNFLTPRAQSYVKMCNRNVLIMVVVLPSNFISAREGKAGMITCLENS